MKKKQMSEKIIAILYVWRHLVMQMRLYKQFSSLTFPVRVEVASYLLWKAVEC